ncbi:hypothetical protein BASA81_008422 [Batrachochytrium salamandrivorans]|nr:hypothetical protein BASA81_008422 [Batrachochytrium salamandrivorans]
MDFSQYRRALSKHQRHPGLPVLEADANTISMFLAQSNPVIFVFCSGIIPSGVFAKGGGIDVKACVHQLKQLKDVENKQILCDTLHYSTRSFDKAPDNIKRVLESQG